MRYVLTIALCMPLAALSPSGQDNAVATQKQRFEQLRRDRFPLWPQNLVPGKTPPASPGLKLPQAKPPMVRAFPAPVQKDVCSVPLKRALRPGQMPPMPQIRPDDRHRVMPEVQVPAPSCDDVGRK